MKPNWGRGCLLLMVYNSLKLWICLCHCPGVHSVIVESFDFYFLPPYCLCSLTLSGPLLCTVFCFFFSWKYYRGTFSFIIFIPRRFRLYFYLFNLERRACFG